MKKLFLLLAVASLALISCNKDENEDTQSQQQTITLHASVDLSNLGTRVAPNASELEGSGSTVNFHWEDGDQVTISNNSESSTFTVKASTINGNSADFEGIALSDMSNYTVSYNTNATTVAYASGTFKPVCSGTGSNTNFSISTFQPVIKLQLTGSVTLGKIEYWAGATSAPTTTLTFNSGLTLTGTAQTVYFPVTAASTNGLTFKFYDNATTPELIMEKTTSSNVEVGKITTFPVLEVKKPKIVLLSGDFSVSSTKKVKFTKGNLYYSTTDNAYHIEANQTDYLSSWDATHVDHFYWVTPSEATVAATAPWAEAFGTHTQATTDKFFCGEDNKLTVDGQSDLYALSIDEWGYLINTRTNASSLHKYGVTVSNGGTNYENCLIIAPDNYSGTELSAITDWSLSNINTLGLVCLPAAGYRDGSSFGDGGSYGYYWSATPYTNFANGACRLYFYSSYVGTNYSSRGNGYSVRLVK